MTLAERIQERWPCWSEELCIEIAAVAQGSDQ